MSGSAGGSGGAIHLKAVDVHIQSKGILDVGGGSGGGAGGRVFLESNNTYVNDGVKNIKLEGGDGSVQGTPGTFRILRPSDLSELDFRTGTLTIDTDSATMLHSGGQVAYGIIEDRFYRDDGGSVWPYSVCRFSFDRIRLSGNLVINLKGKNALILEAVAGNLSLGSNLYANGGDSQDDVGGLGLLGGYDGAGGGTLAGNGPGASSETSDQGHGAAYGGHGSGSSVTYGDRALDDLLGGSSGGSAQDGSGAGGGAIHLKSSAEIIIEPNVLISVNGGSGGSDSGSGAGGAVRLEATRIYNHGRIEARAGSGVTVSGNAQTRGSAGGRVALIAHGEVQVGEVDVSGEWLSNEGSIFVGGSHLDSILSVKDQHVTFDTKTGYFSIEGGAHGVGVITDHTYVDDFGQSWSYQVCTFNFGMVDIRGASKVTLRGDKSLMIQTVAGGDVYLGADFILNGGDADTITGYGGRPVLNLWRGRSSEKLTGFGPGGPPTAGN